MTVNKEKWQELAEKYNTKAKWAEAILFLNHEEHEELISSLIELDPQELVDNSGDSAISLNFSGPSTSALISEVRDPEDVAKNRDTVEDIVKIINRELGRDI